MDLTFLLAAVIFTLLAIVVATSIFNGSPSSVDFARSYFGPKDKAQAGLDKSSAWQNGHITNKKKTADDWNEVSGSSHDHWEVVKSVLSVSLSCLFRKLTPMSSAHCTHIFPLSYSNNKDLSGCLLTL